MIGLSFRWYFDRSRTSMTDYIYARVSTEQQNIKPQIEYLSKKYSIILSNIYSESLSGKSLERPIFCKLKDMVSEGDSIIVQDLSRLGRNTNEVLEFIDDMIKRKISLIVDDLGRIDVTSATGKMVVTTLAAVATMQREQTLEKQMIGIKKAKEEGKYTGKKQSPDTIKKCKLAVNYISKGLTKEASAKATGVGIATLYRFLKLQNTNSPK